MHWRVSCKWILINTALSKVDVFDVQLTLASIRSKHTTQPFLIKTHIFQFISLKENTLAS